MNPVERVTKTTVAVLKVLTSTTDAIWGLEAVRRTGMQTGTVYPIMERLLQAGWLTSEWEVDNERSGPRRRYFALTPEGREGALAVLEKYEEKLKALAEAAALDGVAAQNS